MCSLCLYFSPVPSSYRYIQPLMSVSEIPAGAVFTSIGYQGVSIDETIPFDPATHTIKTDSNGRVTGQPGMYACGWIKRGPRGVILATMTDAFQTGQSILEDLQKSGDTGPGFSAICPLLLSRGVGWTNYEQWKAIERFEVEQGSRLSKVAEKVTSVKEMLAITQTCLID
eukprot:m.339083 g.339083  ORF g.339083 m.339083 type:complete len:170 (-) comp55744_c0_seq4:145-654(-)